MTKEKPAVKEVQSSKPTVNEAMGPKAGHAGGKGDKDADIIVVDASVLVHALYQVKKWSRDGRKEIIIVPLEGVPPPPQYEFISDLFFFSFKHTRFTQEGN
jgi:hypothetical protein